MSLSLFYASSEQIDPGGGTVLLSGGESAHIARSLRCRPGEELLVADGAGNIYTVKLQSVEPAEVRGSIVGQEWVPEERPRLVLMQALGRTAKMDVAVAMAAEAGIAGFVPFVAPRSPEGSFEKAVSRVSRWRKIAFEASKVARRPRPLSVDDPRPWPPDGSILGGQEVNLVLWEDETWRGLEEVLPEAAPLSIGIIVGPEGGFDASEVQYLESAGALATGFGRLILRTQTAGSMVAAVLRYRYGLLRPGPAR